MTLISFFRYALIVLFFLGGTASAETIKVKPTIKYVPAQITFWLACSQGECYDSPGSAFGSYKSIFWKRLREWEINYNQGRDVSFRYQLIDDLRPATVGRVITVNGLPSTYVHTEKFWDTPPHISTWRSDPNRIAVGSFTLCPVGFKQVVTYQGGPDPYNPNIFTYECHYDPPCDPCEKNGQKNLPPTSGNPIGHVSQVKYESATDYAGGGLEFSRHYRSDRAGWTHSYQRYGAFVAKLNPLESQSIDAKKQGCYLAVPNGLTGTECFEYAPNLSKDEFVLQSGRGRVTRFGNGVSLMPANDVDDRVSRREVNGELVGWSVYIAASDATEEYGLDGRLQLRRNANGEVQTYTYSDALTPPEVAREAGLLIKVTTQFNRSLSFTYDDAGRLKTMTDPAGGVYQYAYDEASSIQLAANTRYNNLTSVTFPDSKKRVYWYNEQDRTANTNLPTALTGITDENGARYATFTYDSTGKAIISEHANGVEKYTFSKSGDRAYVVDPLGKSRSYSLVVVNGEQRQTAVSEPSSDGANKIKSVSYDANNNIAQNIDFKDVKTDFTYDLSRNLETKRIEASGKSEARTISTQWHATYRIPVQIDEPLRRTTFTHDANGNVLTKTEQATTDTNGSQGAAATVVGAAKVWTYTYNSFGQVLTAKGPRTDINDLTSYVYDNQGNLTSVTNPAGHVTTMSNYDAHGRVGLITDPNGVTTALTYHPRGWLLSRAVTADGVTETTSYTYDGVGQMTQVTLPDNSVITYTYDDAHRLTKVSDHLGNSITYTLDNMGNRVKEEVKDASGTLTQQVTRVYDILNRLKEVTGSAQ